MNEKKSYEVNLEDMVYRRAKITDNMEEIAALIYDTDPYIYPFWFNNNREDAIDFLKDKIIIPGFVFNYENIYVACDKLSGRIYGILVAIDPSVDLNFDYGPYEKINERYNFTINNYIKPCIHELNEIQGLYIMNVCVSAGCRGRKIGTGLMGHFISFMEQAGFENYKLDCLLHNLRAKNLYHSMGFKEVKEIVGFDGTDHSTVEVVTFTRHKGDYLPSEFQKEQNYPGINN